MAIEGINQHPFDACAYCGRPFESGVRYPVRTREDPSGNLELYSFCDGACRTAWSDDR